MKRLIYVMTLLVTVLTMGSCVDEETFDNTQQGNFEALWKIMDEHYCFFDYKKEECGVDWNEVYTRYKPMVNGANTEQLFEVLARMVGELKDGHVNLGSSFNLGRNWSWKEDYPTNYSDTLYNRYMGTDYRIASGIYYRILDDNVGYMRVSTFGNDFGDGNLDEILMHFIACRSIIIDIRENGGGLVTASERLASRFTNNAIRVGYMQHKTGTGHNDFSDLEDVVLKPSANMRWQKPVFVLTNRGVFSAANEFVMYMKQCPNVTIIGDKTGGGAGMPFTSELPNGWTVRFSAVPMYDVDKKSTEHGIEPDIYCSITDDDFSRGVDTIIEKAREMTK